RGPPLLTLDSDWPGFLAEPTPGCKTRRLRVGWSEAARAGHGSDEDGLGRHVGRRHRALVDELPRVEAVVEAAAREELRVRALLDDAAPVEDQDPVRALDRRQPVRDHDRRAATHQTVKGLLNEEFALVVERAGGLVEEKDPGVAKDRPGDGDALPLSDRQPDAALADDRLHALRHSRDELGGVRGSGRILDLRLRRVEPPVANVLADRVAEKDRLLRHDRDLLAERTQRDFADVSPIDAHPTTDRVVEAADEIHERRLAGARRTDERGRLAFAEHGRQRFEYQRPFAVLEGHRVELDLAAHRADRSGAREVADVRLGVEQSEDPVGRAERLLDPRPLTRETADRTGHHSHVEKECDELTRGELTTRHLV